MRGMASDVAAYILTAIIVLYCLRLFLRAAVRNMLDLNPPQQRRVKWWRR